MGRSMGSRLSRESIRDAAMQLFALRGFAGTSIADISGRLGVTKGALYYHYPEGKEEIFRAAIAALDDRVMAEMEAAVETTPDPVQGLTAAIEAKIDALRAMRDEFSATPAVVQELIATISTRRAELRQRERRLYAELLERGCADGLMRPLEPRAEVCEAIQMLVMTLESVELVEERGDGEGRSPLFRTLLDVMLRGLLTEARR